MENTQKLSILIVDDDKSHLNVLAHILRRDYMVYTAKNGKTGLEIANEYVPDLILLDIIMPDMDGYDVFKELKIMDKTKSIPVIFVTSLVKKEDIEKGMAMGAVDYITKPLNTASVKEKVNAHINA
jgi:response regulator RpfG family c-di-GMP phosphodiesterase